MTNKNKRSKARTTAPPAAAQASPPSGPALRRGLLGSIFAPRVGGASSMPNVRASLARGVTVVAGTPAIAIGAVLLLAAEPLGAVVLGYQGPFARFVSALAVPPLGTSFDATMSTALFGLQGGFLAILGFVALRAIVQALLVAAIVQALRSTPVGRSTVALALRTLPVALAVNMFSVGLLIVTTLVGSVVPTLTLFLQLGALVGGVYLLSFAPVIAAHEGRRLPDSMGRSVRAARLPGAGNLTLAAIYVVASFMVAAIPWPGSELGVNPTVGAWAVVFVAGLLHVAMQAAVAFRYLSVASEVPGPAPGRRGAPRSRTRR